MIIKPIPQRKKIQKRFLGFNITLEWTRKGERGQKVFFDNAYQKALSLSKERDATYGIYLGDGNIQDDPLLTVGHVDAQSISHC